MKTGPENADFSSSPEEQHAPSQTLYFPLLQGQVIRLLQLMPGVRDDVVSTRMLVAELGYHPDYEALSYVWGDPNNTVPITCNGREMPITRNLDAAFRRVRYPDRVRTLWADAMCINQRNMAERSHHVGFMGDVYRNANTVLVCMGPDSDGKAEDVASLVKENAELVSKYSSILDMPVLPGNDTVLDDPRWAAMATLTQCVWFSRAWVMQEVGLAKVPIVLYGSIEFKYRDLMNLATWVTHSAPMLEVRAGVSFHTSHMDWGDWTPDWKLTSTFPKVTLLDLLNHTQSLGCKEYRDHIYAFLSHPLAQRGGKLIVEPDYEKPIKEIYLELGIQMFEQEGLRLLSPVEHTEETLCEDFPTWIPLSRPVEITQCTFGIYTGFYYDASVGMEPGTPQLIEESCIKTRGIVLGTVRTGYEFLPSDFESPIIADTNKEALGARKTLDLIWKEVQDAEGPHFYGKEDRVTAFSLTLCAGLSTYRPADLNFAQHQREFAAYWAFHTSTQQAKSNGNSLITPAAESSSKEDCEKFLVDMNLVCDGRSFFFTQTGFYGLGPLILKPGDICCILFGAKVPFILRQSDGSGKYRLVGEAYLHGVMRGEAAHMEQLNAMEGETFVIC
jgi:hypothetical protein